MTNQGWVTKKKEGKRSPLRDRPLRYPGQSLDDELQKLLEKMDEILLVPLLFFAFALQECVRWYFKYQASLVTSVLSIFMAIVVSIWAAIRIRRMRQIKRQLILARDGERVVGQYLEELRGKGYRVLHDIVGTHFNIDHVVIAPTGIFTIETKTVSKPLRGETVITFDGEKTLVNGRTMERDPIIQARSQASWIKDFLKSSLGKTFPVRPVVLFPGWFIKGTPACSDVWVLNEKVLPSFIEHEPTILGPDDLQTATFQLSQYIKVQ